MKDRPELLGKPDKQRLSISSFSVEAQTATMPDRDSGDGAVSFDCAARFGTYFLASISVSPAPRPELIAIALGSPSNQ